MAKQRIFAKELLTPEGWRRDQTIDIDASGRITAIGDNANEADVSVGVLLPAPGNAHSHSFQRAMAGLTEYRGPNPRDDFWTWRALMYHFVERLTPNDIEAIAAQVQMEMLEAGFTSVGEFHYLHHQPDGTPYDNPGELAERIFAAAKDTGIGYTHLPVLYMRGGMDGRPLAGGQRRFGCTLNQYAGLIESANQSLNSMPADAQLGVAPHSLRAVDKEALNFATSLNPNSPVHIHAAEQIGEVDEAITHLGARPIEWLLNNTNVDRRWVLVHATQMTDQEISNVATAGAVIAACPMTESNLGDGIFEARKYLGAGGRMAIGSDSNIRISLAEELRTLEHSQRLRDRERAVLATADKSCGRTMLDHAARGGAQALARDAGRIEVGALADLFALDVNDPVIAGLSGDRALDAWVFAGGDAQVSDVWAAGRHMVKDGRHIKRETIAKRFNKIMSRLRSEL